MSNQNAPFGLKPVGKVGSGYNSEGVTEYKIASGASGNIFSEDKKNVMSRLREGFELVTADEIGDFELPSIDDGKHAGVVSVGGLLLAKIPNETREERNAYFSDRAQQQQEAIDNDLLKESDPSSPMLKPQRTSSVTFGGGKRS